MIVGSFVVKNEADRYLDSVLRHSANIYDELFVFDDSSDDNTVEIARQYTNNVFLNDSVSFMEHEGHFRYNAWRCCIKNLSMTEKDWIFVNDSDEFLSLEGKQYEDLNESKFSLKVREEIDKLVSLNLDCYKIHIPDVKTVDSKKIYIRTDGFWNSNYAPRFGKALDLPFMNKAMGSFSVPERFVVDSILPKTDLKLLHFGYVRPEDVETRYLRYTSMKNHGHNDKHIKSIKKLPNTKLWEGKTVDV